MRRWRHKLYAESDKNAVVAAHSPTKVQVEFTNAGSTLFLIQAAIDNP
jgi:hypothetical protein